MEAPAEDTGLARILFFFLTLVAGHGRSLSLTLSETRVYEPQITPASEPLHIYVEWLFLNCGQKRWSPQQRAPAF